MATVYERQVTPSPATDDTILATHINSEFDYLLTALNDFDASNCKKSGTSIPLANITNLTSTQMSAVFFKDEDDMASNSATAVSSQQAIKAFVDASSTDGWTPSSYAGDESITFPNGLIMKQGSASKANGESVTFAVAFPTAVIFSSCNIPGSSRTSNGEGTLTKITFAISGTGAVTLEWQVWGH